MDIVEEEEHDGVVFFEGSPDGSDEVDTKLHRPVGLSCTRCFGG